MTKHPRYNKKSTKSKESLRVIRNTRKYLLIERKKAANDSFNNSSRYFTGFERQYCDVCSKFLGYGPQKVCRSLLKFIKSINVEKSRMSIGMMSSLTQLFLIINLQSNHAQTNMMAQKKMEVFFLKLQTSL